MPADGSLRPLSISALICALLLLGLPLGGGCGGTADSPADGGAPFDASMGGGDGPRPGDLGGGDGGHPDGGMPPVSIPWKPQCSAAGFCWVSPLPQGNDLNGTWGSSPSDVWAVGNHGTILHWDGTIWDSVASPVTSNLNGISGTGSSDVWVVGDGGVLLHWDGATWSKQTSPTMANLSDIWLDGKGEGWAVGSMRVIRRHAGAWTVPTSQPGDLNTYVGVWGSSASDIWVAGSPGGLVHWDGALWTQHPQFGSSAYVRGVYGFGPNDVWVAAGGLYHLHDGKVDLISLDGTFNMQAVFGSGPNDIWALSYQGGDGTLFQRHHFDGKNWTFTNLERYFYPARGFSPRAGESWTVGSNGYLARADGDGRWTRVGSGPGAQVNGLYVSAANEAWAVPFDSHQPLWHFDGTSWSFPDVGVNVIFDAIAGAGTNLIWLVGHDTVMWDGSKWSYRGSGGNHPMLWISATGDDAWAIFSYKLFRYSGMAWGAITDGSSYDAVSGSDRNNVWAIQYDTMGNYTPRHWDGTTWHSTPVLRNLQEPAIYAASDKDVWIAGSDGIVNHWDGTAWTPTTLDAGVNVKPTICGAKGEVWLTHGSNTFVRRAGSWTQIDTGSNQTGRSIQCRDGVVWLAGNGGMVLRKN